MDFPELDAVTTFIMLGMVAGVVEMVKRAFAKDWRAVAIIFGAGVTGGLVAIPLGVSVLAGVVVGFAASGLVTIAQNIGWN